MPVSLDSDEKDVLYRATGESYADGNLHDGADSSTASTGDGSDSELLVDLTAAQPALEQDECTEGWAGADCQDCAPGFHGDFCDQRIAVQPVPGAPAPDSQLPAPVAAPVLPPRRGAIDLRDYVLPPADENETATPGVGMPVFSRGISVVAAHEMLSMAGHAPLVSI